MLRPSSSGCGAAPSRLRVSLVLFLSVVALLPGRRGGAVGIHAPQRVFQVGHDRAAMTASSTRVRRRRTTVACMNHCTASGGPVALAGPFLPSQGRGSMRPRASPPMLWALISAAGVLVSASVKSAVSNVLASEGGDGQAGGGGSNKVGAAMISFIKAYKRELSPLIPPACRFLPTCSVYGVEAIEKFGPTKGAVLTAWRLMRCNPFAGYGIDYPQWPPPGWFAGEKW